MKRFQCSSAITALAACVLVAACGDKTSTTAPPVSLSITPNPCGGTGTVTLGVASAVLKDCSAGGTTLTLAGGGASYLIVPQFPTETAPDQYVLYQMFTGPVTGASASLNRIGAARLAMTAAGGMSASRKIPGRNMLAQHAADRRFRAKEARTAGSAMRAVSLSLRRSAAVSAAVLPPPAVGSLRTFHVANSMTVNTYATVGARLTYIGANIFVYVDTLAPAAGFTPAQLSAFGLLFDQTFYPLDTLSFGSPGDVDNNGHVIMLMSPTVNAITTVATCQTQGYVAGYFDPGDFDGPSDPNSNQGEIFYSIVPDPNGQFSCTHTVADVGSDVPGTFMHELQHLINYSQHVVVSGGQPGTSWMDEGMSILAEELGSLYYEAKYTCPGPQCTGGPGQSFPDSSQGFVQDFLYDSYQYALLPDTASIMLSDDSEGGFSWRGGAWLFARYLGDHYGSTIFRQLETGPSDVMADVQQATGQPFTTLFANLGLAIWTDSLPGLPRSTAPLAYRFVSRNMRQLWSRVYAAYGPASDIPYVMPAYLFPITGDTTTNILLPGTMTFFRIDTPASSTTVTIQFAPPGGVAFMPALHSQIAVFRLPPGQ